MLNYLFMTMGPGSSPDPNIYYRTVKNNTIFFETAWSPSSPVIAALAKKYPTMRFEHYFHEVLAGYQGQEIYENGELISYDYGELEFDED